jgi:long-chain acyl-CoA synthetase
VPFVQQVMLYNQQNPYTVALLVLEPERVVAWARSRGLDLARDEGLNAVILHVAASLRAYKEDATLATRFVATWTPRTFAVLPEPFSEDNRMINSGLKMVRRTIATVYKDAIAALYGANADPVNTANRETLRKLLGSPAAR